MFPVDKEIEPQLLVTFCFDNTPATCSSVLIRASSLSDAEDHQVHQFSNGPDPSLVLNGFDVKCTQADGSCTESNMKNSKVGNCKKLEGVFPHKPITKYRELAGESMVRVKLKEFEDIQSGNKENCESFVLPGCGAEFKRNEEGLEEPRSDVRSGVRNEKNSEETEEKYGELRSGDIGDVTCANREEVLYNPIQAAPSQNEFQSTTGSRRPTRSTVRPSRFRDDAFVTQFRPGRKKKIWKMCFHPGRGDIRGFSSVDGVCNLNRKQ